MKLANISALLTAFVLSTALHASPQSTPSVFTDVTATVQLLDQSTHRPQRDLSGVAVWLVPLGEWQNPVTQHLRYRMVQKDKHFEPHLLVVPVGTLVEFPNLDPWFHNVFSMYRGKRFDLGLYQAGDKKTVRFDKPGPSYIFCNIHPEMTAVVLAVNSSYIGISAPSGRVVIRDVPPGEYEVNAWHERSSTSVLTAMQKKIVVGEKGYDLGVLTVSMDKQTTEAHKNKYGHDYDPKTLDPQY